jgi:AcrR family transcriptional regulator
MMSQDLNTEVAPRRAANAIPEDQILDAATRLMSTIGIRRTTMADIARAADVSRATLYRRFPNIEAVAAQVTTREFLEILASGPQPDGASARATAIATVVHLVSAAREHPLLRRIVELDPEFLMPYLLQRLGRTSRGHLEILAALVRSGQIDGSVRGGDTKVMATTLLQMAWSFTFTGPVFAGPGSGDVLDSELAELMERYLRP